MHTQYQPVGGGTPIQHHLVGGAMLANQVVYRSPLIYALR